MNLINLNDVRTEMVAEFDSDVAADDLYLSPRLTVDGAAEYPDLLRMALLNGDDATIIAAIGAPGRLNTHETARHPKGGPDIVKEVPITAPQTMGEGEFNRFYARGVCVHAIEASGPNATVTIYRARPSANPRAESAALEETTISAAKLLADLRGHIGVQTALGLGNPNS